jgi:hypothetical protein
LLAGISDDVSLWHCTIIPLLLLGSDLDKYWTENGTFYTKIGLKTNLK